MKSLAKENTANNTIIEKTHSIVVNGVVFNKDCVLVSQRSWNESHGPGKWTIPGGKVELTTGNIFNILEKTVKREITEETGVQIKDKINLIVNNTFIRSGGQHVIAMVFKCYYKSGKLQPLEDTIDCKWATLDEIKKMEFAPNVKEYILKAYNSK